MVTVYLNTPDVYGNDEEYFILPGLLPGLSTQGTYAFPLPGNLNISYFL